MRDGSVVRAEVNTRANGKPILELTLPRGLRIELLTAWITDWPSFVSHSHQPLYMLSTVSLHVICATPQACGQTPAMAGAWWICIESPQPAAACTQTCRGGRCAAHRCVFVNGSVPVRHKRFLSTFANTAFWGAC